MALTALRRHARERAYRRALSIASLMFSGQDEEWRAMWASKIAKNRKVCSCWKCGNPRRYFKGDDRLTLPEKRARCSKDTNP